MIESFPLAAAFTVLFTVTGLFHLRRCAALWSAGPVAGQDDRAVELGHLLMSLAMIGMAWAWGGPNAWWLQIAVFGVLTALFLVRAAATQGGTARGPHTGRAAFGYHALAMGAMTWMVAAMPLLGHSIGAAGSGHHHDGAATAAPAMTSMGAPPWWATGVTVLLAGALGVSAFVWAAVSARTPAPAPVAVAAGTASAGAASDAGLTGAASTGAASTGAGPDATSAGAGSPVVAGAAGTAAAVAGAAVAGASFAEPAHDRPAGWCHALMGVGMAAMLLVMV